MLCQQPVQSAVKTFVDLRNDVTFERPHVPQLEQLHKLQQQQAILTEQSKAVRMLLKEYDDGETEQSSPGQTPWFTQSLDFADTSSPMRTGSTLTMKKLCQKQRRTAQILKHVNQSARITSSPAIELDRRMMITPGDIRETLKRPPVDTGFDDDNIRARLPSQIKLQELMKEHTKQMAESHDKYRAANRGKYKARLLARRC